MAEEFFSGDYILVLDGRILEIFRPKATESQRYHVNYLRVDGKETDNGYRVRLGATADKDAPANSILGIYGGVTLDLTTKEFGQFREFISAAITARDGE
jgi:hypothetical protein